MNLPMCNDRRSCFAQNGGVCIALDSTYLDGECPFYKSPEQRDYELKINRYRSALWRK